MSKSAHPVELYAQAFSDLSPATIDQLCNKVSNQIYFSDPFNKIKGKKGFRAIFDHMYSVCDEPTFQITDVAHSMNASYLRWCMKGRLKSWPYTNLNFVGITEVRCDANGLITHHIDHWDSASQLLQYLPLIGFFTKTVRRLFKIPNN